MNTYVAFVGGSFYQKLKATSDSTALQEVEQMRLENPGVTVVCLEWGEMENREVTEG